MDKGDENFLVCDFHCIATPESVLAVKIRG